MIDMPYCSAQYAQIRSVNHPWHDYLNLLPDRAVKNHVEDKPESTRTNKELLMPDNEQVIGSGGYGQTHVDVRCMI